MSFDAGSVEASLTLDTSKFDRSLSDSEAKVKAFEDGKHEVKISAVFDQSSISRARQQFAQLDQQVSKDAMSRLRSSPQGSVLGALNALFSPHPVTGAPSASQAAQQGLLGKIISQPGGGAPGTTGGTVVQDVLGSGSAQSNANNITTTDRVNTVGLPTNGSISTEDRVNVTGLPTSGGTIVTEDKVKTDLDTSGVKAEATQAGKDAADAADDALTKEAKSKGSGWFSGFLNGISGLIGSAVSGGGGNGNGKNGNSGSGDASALDSGLAGGIGPSILGIPTSTLLSKWTAAITTGLAALPAVAGLAGTGIGVALIGGAVAAVVATSPKLKAQFTTIGADAKTALTAAAAPLIPALSAVLGQVPALIKQLQAPLAGIFKTIAPQIQGIFAGLTPILQGVIGVMQAAAPAFGPFIEGLEKLAGNIFPGIETVVKATVPVISQFGTILGQLGTNLGGLFADAAPGIQASMQVLGDLLGVVGGLLPVLTQLGDIFAKALAPAFAQVGAVVKALEPVLLLVGKVVSELAQAVVGDLVAAFGAIAKAVQAATPGLTVLATGLGKVFTTLENTGVFAELGDALENLATPLGNMISQIAEGLAPILPPVVSLIGQLAGLFTGAMQQAITQLLPPLTNLATTVLGALDQVLPSVSDAFVKLVTALLTPGLVSAVTNLVTQLANLVAKAAPGYIQGIADALTGIVNVITAPGVVNTITSIVNGLAGLIAKVPPAVLADIALGLVGISLAIKGITFGKDVLSNLATFVNTLKNLPSTVTTKVKSVFSASDDAAAADEDTAASGMQKAGDTMVTAAASMQKAADTMAGTAGGEAEGAAEIEAAEAAGGAEAATAFGAAGLGTTLGLAAAAAIGTYLAEKQFSNLFGQGVAAANPISPSGAPKEGAPLSAVLAGTGTNTTLKISTDTGPLDSLLAKLGLTQSSIGAINKLTAKPGSDVGALDTLLYSLGASQSDILAVNKLVVTPKSSTDAVDALLTRINLTPGEIGLVNKLIAKPGSDTSDVDALLKEIGLTPAQIAAVNKLVVFPQSDTSAVDALLAKIGLTPGDIANVNKLIAKPGSDTANIDALLAKIGLTPAQIAAVNKLVVKPTSDSKPVTDLQAVIDALHGKSVTVSAAVAAAIASVNSFQSMVNSLQGKTVTIDAQVVGPTAVVGAFLSGIGAATGGLVNGPGGPTDDAIPAWLSNGEYVISAGAVSKYGKGFLDDVNAMELAGGGMVANYGASYARTYALGRAAAMAPAGGKTTDDLAARLDQLHADMREMVNATRAVPAGVGQHVGGAINGAAHDASFRSRYPRGGS